MRYEGKLYRPPSEADAVLLQATIGCSWNACVYCDMYREKRYRVRDLAATLDDVAHAARVAGDRVEKVFVCDGDALGMPMDHWSPILAAVRAGFPWLKRISCYAMARNVAAKTDAELAALVSAGLTRIYIGPESGDPVTLKHIAKGDGFDAHVDAARRVKAAGMEVSAIFLLGAGGVERSAEHAEGSAALATAMDPEFLSALTLTVVPGTPLERLAATGRFELPSLAGLLGELRTFVALTRPTGALFRTNHASNHLPLAGRLPDDGPRIVARIDAALQGRVPLRPEWRRGL
ncbi:MAG: radical SAM protein [Myxococcota bacterium]